MAYICLGLNVLMNHDSILHLYPIPGNADWLCNWCQQYTSHCLRKYSFMMTSSYGNIFRVTGPLCGAFTGPGEFPAQKPVTRSFDVFFDLRLNKRLSKQLWGWWFETLSWSLWRQCNVIRWTKTNPVRLRFSRVNSLPNPHDMPPFAFTKSLRYDQYHKFTIATMCKISRLIVIQRGRTMFRWRKHS